MSERSKRVGRKKLSQKREELITQLWGEDSPEVWNRHDHDGYATIPRTMPHICRVMEGLSGSGSPLSQTYMALWFRVYDEGFVEVKDQEALAYESGFSGQRAVTTWIGRMRKLKELGFIDAKSISSREFQYVLLLNPLTVITGIYDSGTVAQDARYDALAVRLLEVGGRW